MKQQTYQLDSRFWKSHVMSQYRSNLLAKEFCLNFDWNGKFRLSFDILLLPAEFQTKPLAFPQRMKCGGEGFCLKFNGEKQSVKTQTKYCHFGWNSNVTLFIWTRPVPLVTWFYQNLIPCCKKQISTFGDTFAGNELFFKK